MSNPPIDIPTTPLSQFFGTTPSESLPPPYKNFAADPKSVQTGAQTVFPPFSTDPNDPNSLVSIFGAPDGFDLSPSQLQPSVFAGWVSEYQIEYLTKNGGGSASSPNIVTIGGGTDANNNPIPAIHAMISDGAATGGIPSVYILENLSAKDFAAMSLNDQNFLAQQSQSGANSALLLSIFTGLGLSTNKNTVDMFDLTSTQNPPPPNPNSELGKALADINDPNITSLTSDEKQIFIDELNNIETRLKTQAIFSPDDINSAAQAVQDRFDTVVSFAKLPQPGTTVDVPNGNGTLSVDLTQLTPAGTPPLITNVVSLDATTGNNFPGGSPSINTAKEQMLQAERKIRAADNAMMAVTGLSSNSSSRHLSAPDLLAAYMENAAIKDQAINAFDTQKINMLNNLVDLYNTMEELINKTLQTVADKNNNDPINLLGGSSDFTALWNKLNPDQKAALSAFLQIRNVTISNPNFDPNNPPIDPITGEPITDSDTDANGNSRTITLSNVNTNLDTVPNPLETSNNVTRPSFPIVDIDESKSPPTISLVGESQTQWNTFLTQLTDSTTQLNQASQLAFSQINSRQQQLATFDDSASGALSGALTLIQNIGQNMVIN